MRYAKGHRRHRIPGFLLGLLCAAFLTSNVPYLNAAPTAPPSQDPDQDQPDQPPPQQPPPGAVGGKHNTDEPTTLLFTAINEGNVPYVREAINRGADLDGHNILGQTPLDMSIDLNRNPITFLLLSLRSHKGHNTASKEPPPVSPQPDLPQNSSEKAALLSNLPLAAPQYDTEGISQNPSHGFLGFDGS